MRRPLTRPACSLCMLAAALVLACAGASARAQGQAPPPQPSSAQIEMPRPPIPKGYPAVAVQLAQPFADASFTEFRARLAETAGRKDRTALKKLVAPQGFFWMTEGGDKADERQSGFANLTVALGLDGEDDDGWRLLAAMADDPTLEAMDGRDGVMCGPAAPQLDDHAFERLVETTDTGPDEWGVPTRARLEMRETPQRNAPVIETLGMHLVRVFPEAPRDQPPEMLRVLGPSGKVGYVPLAALAPLASDQMCYVKQADGWKITGYVGQQ